VLEDEAAMSEVSYISQIEVSISANNCINIAFEKI
jgi:hypothetical protein